MRPRGSPAQVLLELDWPGLGGPLSLSSLYFPSGYLRRVSALGPSFFPAWSSKLVSHSLKPPLLTQPKATTSAPLEQVTMPCPPSGAGSGRDHSGMRALIGAVPNSAALHCPPRCIPCGAPFQDPGSQAPSQEEGRAGAAPHLAVELRKQEQIAEGSRSS